MFTGGCQAWLLLLSIAYNQMNTLFDVLFNIIMCVIMVVILFAIIFALTIPVYKWLARLFNKIEEAKTGIKKQDAKNLNLPLEQLSKIQVLSLRDTFLVYFCGLFPFLGWLFLPSVMRYFNIRDYYELRFKSGMEKINENEKNIKNKNGRGVKLNTLYRFKSFESLRADIAITLSGICIAGYIEDVSHLAEYLSYLGLRMKGIYQKESFADILLYIKSQLSLPFFDSVFTTSSWLLVLAGIFYCYYRYWTGKSVERYGCVKGNIFWS
jgi:hypothetical protein